MVDFGESSPLKNTSAERLTHYDLSVPISVACDASSVGIGAVNFHTFPDGRDSWLIHHQVVKGREIMHKSKGRFGYCLWSTRIQTIYASSEVYIIDRP